MLSTNKTSTSSTTQKTKGKPKSAMTMEELETFLKLQKKAQSVMPTAELDAFMMLQKKAKKLVAGFQRDTRGKASDKPKEESSSEEEGPVKKVKKTTIKKPFIVSKTSEVPAKRVKADSSDEDSDESEPEERVKKKKTKSKPVIVTDDHDVNLKSTKKKVKSKPISVSDDDDETDDDDRDIKNKTKRKPDVDSDGEDTRPAKKVKYTKKIQKRVPPCANCADKNLKCLDEGYISCWRCRRDHIKCCETTGELKEYKQRRSKREVNDSTSDSSYHESGSESSEAPAQGVEKVLGQLVASVGRIGAALERIAVALEKRR